jgi:cellulase (glycosyl hydrolase family 5)
MPRLTTLCAAALAALALASPAFAGRGMLVGAAEDAGKAPDLVTAKAKMDLAQLAGFDAIRETTIWTPGQTAPGPNELAALKNSADAAQLDGIRVILAVYQWGAKTTPLTPAARAQYAAFCASLAKQLPNVHDFIVGNEPNLNRFWWPQFGPKGIDVAARDYERLLAQSYDALKAVDPKVNVIGGAVSPHGGDDPTARRKTHSPTTFIPDLGRYYRASGRTKPIMDTFDFHPYPDNSHTPPDLVHPLNSTVSLADYTKLVSLLGKAFDGTAQLGSRLPVYYDEYGVQSQIPGRKDAAYTNLLAPSAGDAVSEAIQADYYRWAIDLAYCQPTVKAFLIFHVADEPDLDRWQSGVFYADDTPKSSMAPVRAEALAARAGSIPGCGTTAGHRMLLPSPARAHTRTG